MEEAILNILMIIGWLGIVLGILAIVNIVVKTLINIWKNEEHFNWRKMAKGIIKVFVFYFGSSLVAIAFTILPFINEMITNTFSVELFTKEILEMFSSIGILSIVVSTIVLQAKKAIQAILELAKLSSDEEIEKIDK